MLHDLDETIKQVLIRAGELDPAQVDISFEIPTRDWSAGITKPTLNCYLFDLHERRLLREDGWTVENRGGREAARRQPPLFFELSYLITAWTAEVEDEHQLLWQVVSTLVRYPILNDERAALDRPIRRDGREERQLLRDCLVGGLREHPWPIHTTVAQLEGVLKSPGEFWTALENQLKPSVSYTVTLGLDRQAVAAGPPVLSTGIRLRLPEATATDDGFRVDLTQIVALPADTPRAGITIGVQGRAERAVTDEHGMAVLRGLPPGRHVLFAEVAGQTHHRTLICAPAGPAAQPAYRDVVRDQLGRPLAGVEVEVEGLPVRATTDAEGQFALPLAPGRYTLLVRLEGWTERRQILVRSAGYTLTFGIGGPAAGRP